jgi:hypothetical protein
MGVTNTTEMESGVVLKVTPVDGNANAISIITGTEEPFEKIFKNGIKVQDSSDEGNQARIETDLIVSGSFIHSNIFEYSGGSTTLTETNFNDSSVLLISPNFGATVTVRLPSSGTGTGEAKLFIIKKLSALGTVTIDPAGGSTTIDGATTKSATAQWSFCQIIYSGNTTDDYLIIANNGFS